jgi:Mg2+/Co2+ transporter CorB
VEKPQSLWQARLCATCSEYGDKTYGEIKDLAKQGDMKAQGMKKLIEQSERLMEKVGNK